MKLGPLFHWSTTSRRDTILKEGLRPGSEPQIAGMPLAYVCCAQTPSMAWGLSGDMSWGEPGSWDLWQLGLQERAEVHVRPFYGSVIEEIQVFTTIPPAMLWLVGSREKVV